MEFIAKSIETGKRYKLDDQEFIQKMIIDIVKKEPAKWTLSEFQRSDSDQDIWEIYLKQVASNS